MEIIEISAKKKESFPIQKLKVAAYCRVSKNSEELLNSLDIQKQHYETLITNNPLWDNGGIFADVASGRNMRVRSDFQKMLKACRKGKINLTVQNAAAHTGELPVTPLKGKKLSGGVLAVWSMERKTAKTPRWFRSSSWRMYYRKPLEYSRQLRTCFAKWFSG